MVVSLEKLYALYQQCYQIVIDSRKIQKNDLFFALKGDHADGNVYAEKAIEAGALGAVVDNPELAEVPGCYLVEDVLTTLQDLAKKHRSGFTWPVIGLTGSNGKTTTKELIHAVLQTTFQVQATKGNLNNHLGVPLTILSVRQPLDFLIVEMGANHQGEIEFLCGIAMPDFGLITNIGKAHLEGFGGIEGVKKGKSELYRYLSASSGHIFINGDDEVLQSLIPVLDDRKIHRYYPGQYATPSQGNLLNFLYQGEIHQSNLTGEYNLPNIAAAIYIGEFFGVVPSSIAEAISTYYPDNNRSQSKLFEGLHLIMDAYNANPSSMKASIENFSKIDAKDKILVLGDMFELGEYSAQEHAQLTAWVASFPWKQVIFIGQQFSMCQIHQDNFRYFHSVEEAKPFFQTFYHTGAHALLKGSRGIALEKLVQ